MTAQAGHGPPGKPAGATGPTSSVIVEDLVVRYGDVEAVHRASFGVRTGEILGLLGPNGAGKTSVLRVLTTLLRPHGGRAWVAGHDVAHDPSRVRRLIGYVPQAVSADGSLTGRENAMLFAKLHGLARRARRAQVPAMLELMGLAEAGDDLARTYSGGMIRRLEIGSALLSSPSVLLLDEPTSGLDPIARRTVWEHLQALRTERGMTMLVTTHAMDEAEDELHRVRHVPSATLTRVVQPLLWLLVFGAALSRVRDLPSGGVAYQTFIVPGVLAQSVLFIAIFSGLAIIWERDLGITKRMLVAPVPRSAIILGKALGAGVRATVQVLIVLVIVAAVGIPLRWSLLSVVGTLLVCLVGAMLFAAVSMVIASVVRTREQFMGLGQLITLPLFFASNAL